MKCLNTNLKVTAQKHKKPNKIFETHWRHLSHCKSIGFCWRYKSQKRLWIFLISEQFHDQSPYKPWTIQNIQVWFRKILIAAFSSTTSKRFKNFQEFLINITKVFIMFIFDLTKATSILLETLKNLNPWTLLGGSISFEKAPSSF